MSRPFLADGRSLGRVVEALAYLQARCGIYWVIPSSLSNQEAQEIVTTAALMKGESIDFRWKSFNLSLDQWGPELKKLVNGLPRPFKLEQEISLKSQGVEIPIGRIQTYLLSAHLADPESVQRELAAGSTLPLPLRLVPGDSDKGQRVLVP